MCAELDHPGVTYNPWMDKTWCLCGQVVYDGDQFTHAACCGGPLDLYSRKPVSRQEWWSRNGGAA